MKQFLILFLMVNLMNIVSLYAQESKILFTSDRDGNSEIYIMNADGSNQKNLSSHPSNDTDPTWAPDGSRIAFVSDRDGNREIYLMTLETGKITRLTNDPGADYSPTWSPDGSMIAFNTNRFGDGSNEILRRNIDGGKTWGLNPTRLTFAQPTHSAKANNFISWSPDGRQIAFESDRDRDDPEIYLINAVDGTNMYRLTYTRALDEVPDWSPDSQKIIYSTDVDGVPQNGNYEIYIMNRDGSEKTRITNCPGADTYPSISADGKFIVYQCNKTGTPEIYRMDIDGNNELALTVTKGFNTSGTGSGNPEFSPF